MNYRKMLVLGLLAVVSSAWSVDYVEVTNVVARQRYPWNGLVDIDFQLDFRVTEPYQMYVEAFDNVGKTNLPVRSVYVPGVSYPDNPCMVRADTTRIVWDAAKDLPNGFKCENVLISCRDTRMVTETNRYVIVDLSAGPNADSYPVTYASQPPRGGWTEEYMTTKLVLRRINPGSFVMGSPLSESGRSDNEDRHVVTLTKPYYIAIYELTARQYALIMGGDSDGDDTKPVEKDWADIRGRDVKILKDINYGGSWGTSVYYRGWYENSIEPNEYTWPYMTNDKVVEDSLLWVLRSKTGLQFSLPTEAQWERACRGGSLTPLYTGKEDSELNRAQIQGPVKSDSTNIRDVYVGRYIPNAYGLYDMQGGVREWCLDVYSANLGNQFTVDPIGGMSVTTNSIVHSVRVPNNTYYYRADLQGYNRVIRGTGGRSATRMFGFVFFKTDVFKRWLKNNDIEDANETTFASSLAGIRLAIPLNE